ncbi:MAG: XrtA/PEP-CTERM system-associated ATPase [Candidatus Omnitrophota bacterium]|jgi:general secretion pathway protein A|nr:XrtA-associated ATPase [Candidatus Omnitrophota bacterium]
MYRQFFGLREKPFNITSDPGFLYLSRVHKEAFAHLIYGIKERKGFLEITGEIGAGKTTLCRALLNHLDINTKSAFIFNSTLPEMQLFQTILEDFGVSAEKKTKASMLRQFNNFLLEELSKNNNVVLIIDEAQNLKTSVLEELRILSNLETEKEKLFQMILVGQPELREKLNAPNLKQLRQRIGVRFHITPLSNSEVSEYIYHRLKVAGSGGDIKFSDDAIEMIYKYSGGIPRLINTVCDKALLSAYVSETKHIDMVNVEKCINEIEGVVFA